jgi:hypothetical protein
MTEVYNNTGSDTVTLQKKTATLLSSAVNLAATTTMGTVPANKVWRILSASMSMAIQDAAVQQRNQILLNSVVALSLDAKGIASPYGGVANSVTWSYEACPVLTAGQTVQHVLSHDENASAQVTYVEEAV